MQELTYDQIIQARRDECRRLLLEAGADLTNEWVANIARCGNTENVRLLTEAKADLANERVEYIAEHGKPENIRILIEAKVDLTNEWVANIANLWSPDMVKAHIESISQSQIDSAITLLEKAGRLKDGKVIIN